MGMKDRQHIACNECPCNCLISIKMTKEHFDEYMYDKAESDNHSDRNHIEDMVCPFTRARVQWDEVEAPK